jgi:AcrR family transcriptional regulator
MQTSDRKDARANRSRILLAAREEFGERGLAVEMKDVADRAGVGVGTLYRHFENREGLIAAVIEQTREDLLERVRESFANEPPADAFRSLFRAGVEAHARFGVLTEAVLAASPPAKRRAEFDELVAALMARGMDEGVFRTDLDVGLLISAVEALFESGKIFELAAKRGAVPAADAFADLFLRACYRAPISEAGPALPPQLRTRG